jgi:hypothetical protein
MSVLTERVNEADISPIVYRTARILIDMITMENTTVLDWEMFQAITKCHHKEAARRHLRELAGAGLCTWQGGQSVIVWWLHQHAHGERVNISSEADAQPARVSAQYERVYINGDAQPARVSAHGERVDAHGVRVFGPQLVDDPMIIGNGDLLPDPETPKAVAHGLAVSLLLSCRVAYPMARTLADSVPFNEIRRQVCAWLPMAAGARNPAGLLISRIQSRAPAGPITAAFMLTPYYLDYLTPDEKRRLEPMAEEAAETYSQAAEPAEVEPGPVVPAEPAPAPTEPPTRLQVLWDQAVAEFIAAQPDNHPARKWLAGSRVHYGGLADNGAGVEWPVYRVTVAAGEGVQWLNNRAASALRKLFGAMIQTRIIVVFTREDLEHDA